MHVLRIAVLLIGACGGTKAHPTSRSTDVGSAAMTNGSATPPTAGSSNLASGDCAAREQRMAQRLADLATRTPGFMPVAHDLHAPASTIGKPFDARGFVIAIRKDGKIALQGQLLAMTGLFDVLDAFAKSALEKHVMDGGSSRDAKFPLYLWADRDVPAGTLAEVVVTADKAGSHWVKRLIVAGSGTPVVDKWSAEVTAIAQKLPHDEPEATTYLVGQLRAAIGQCEPIIIALATYGQEGTAAKQTELLSKALPKAVAECACKLPNTDVFEWGVYEWFGASRPALAWVELPKLVKGDKQPIGKLVK